MLSVFADQSINWLQSIVSKQKLEGSRATLQPLASVLLASFALFRAEAESFQAVLPRENLTAFDRYKRPADQRVIILIFRSHVGLLGAMVVGAIFESCRLITLCDSLPNGGRRACRQCRFRSAVTVATFGPREAKRRKRLASFHFYSPSSAISSISSSPKPNSEV